MRELKLLLAKLFSHPLILLFLSVLQASVRSWISTWKPLSVSELSVMYLVYFEWSTWNRMRISAHAHNFNRRLNTLQLLRLKPVSYSKSSTQHAQKWASQCSKVQSGWGLPLFGRLGGLLTGGLTSGLDGWKHVSRGAASVCSGSSATWSPWHSTEGGNSNGWITGVRLSATGTLESLIWSVCRRQT